MHLSLLFKKVSRCTYHYVGDIELELQVGVIVLFIQQYPDMGHALYDIEIDKDVIILTVFPTEG